MIRARYRVGSVVLFTLACLAMAQWMTNPAPRGSLPRAQLNYRINVNTADPATLSLLSGISTKIGGYIVQHRETHGPFKSLEDLDEVNRLGPITIERIAPFICFE